MFQPLTLFNRNRRTPATTSDSSPGDPFYRLHRDMNRLFDEAFSGFGLPSSFRSDGFSGEIAPRIDLRETDEAYEIEADLPGVAEDDVDVQLSDNVLTIRGEKRAEKEEEDKKGAYHYVERAYGSFARSIQLPQDIDPERVKASFKNGVLKLTLAKPPEAARRARRIAINKS
ncbi:MAG: Hsp20/alpha crystallin family protein [Amphiplicatus sp.]